MKAQVLGHKASASWLLLLSAAVFLLPWYKAPPDGVSALWESAFFHAMAGRLWLLPVIVLPIALLVVWQSRMAVKCQAITFLLLALGLLSLLLQVSLIGLNGPLLPSVAGLFPARFDRPNRFGMGRLFDRHCPVRAVGQ